MIQGLMHVLNEWVKVKIVDVKKPGQFAAFPSVELGVLQALESWIQGEIDREMAELAKGVSDQDRKKPAELDLPPNPCLEHPLPDPPGIDFGSSYWKKPIDSDSEGTAEPLSE